ncbi:MAG: hypothetical protein IT536_05705 [Hyphomicrobiales bacterium]|nr:hypothetical protein [Hyphomicrobiales bacterium]
MANVKARIHWLLPFRPQSSNELTNTHVASIRLRAATLLQSERSHQWHLSFGDPIAVEAPDIVVVGKAMGNQSSQHESWLKFLRESKQKGSAIILDYTDHHLGVESPMTPFYRSVLTLVDRAVTSSQMLKQLLSGCYDGPIEVVPDAIEVPIIPPKTSAGSPRTFLWFGHPSNVRYLIKLLEMQPQLFSQSVVQVLTDWTGYQILTASAAAKVPKVLKFIPWSTPALTEASKTADICIIPSDRHSPDKMGASSNRLITAIALGLPTGAAMLPAYADFKQYFADVESPDFLELIEASAAYRDRIIAAQSDLVPEFHIGAIAEKWLRLFDRYRK